MNWLMQAYEEAKKHLSAELMEDYATNKASLSKESIQKVEDHIQNCDRCRSQVVEIV